MKQAFFYLLVMQLFSAKVFFGQDGSLNVGDNAPGLVLTSTNNSIQSFNFPYQNKMVLLFFWSSSVSKSKENIYKYKKLYSKYSDIGYKSADGFDLISVALQSDKIAWSQDLVKYDLLNLNNCIAQKGYNDLFVKNYKIKETNSSFLIDEFGKIVAVNPSLKTIISYLDEKRNVELNPDVQTKIAGKIMFGQRSLTGLANEKIWFMNSPSDTIQSIMLDENGSFFVKDINAQLPMHLFIKSSSKIAEDVPVFLTTVQGEIISPFTKNEIGYEYSLLDAEMPYLKPMSDYGTAPKVGNDKSLNNLYETSQLFKAKEVVLSPAAITKLAKVISKLNENPKTNLEIITHTDSNGETVANSSLTVKQSTAILTYLASKGIAKTRLKALGKGEAEILNTCKDGVKCTEVEHSKNRRTEFKFYSVL
ncbi:MAG: OmpA/MotB domain protein [Bacteroidetes bacterium]|jgi:flagellar motor protein MotB|nr:OmpA/MotB domain protein [Bacteroidota bacterium]MDF2453296.1 OmpA/MotB domain protein [Bacteroidota bacterium]